MKMFKYNNITSILKTSLKYKNFFKINSNKFSAGLGLDTLKTKIDTNTDIFKVLHKSNNNINIV
jgi:hypothetical protein